MAGRRPYTTGTSLVSAGVLAVGLVTIPPDGASTRDIPPLELTAFSSSLTPPSGLFRELLVIRQPGTALSVTDVPNGIDAPDARSMQSRTDSAALLAPLSASAVPDVANLPFAALAVTVGWVLTPLLYVPGLFPPLAPVVGAIVLFGVPLLLLAGAQLSAPLGVISDFIFGLVGLAAAPAALASAVPLAVTSDKVAVADTAESNDHADRFTTETTQMARDSGETSLDDAAKAGPPTPPTAVSISEDEMTTSNEPVPEAEQEASSDAVTEAEETTGDATATSEETDVIPQDDADQSVESDDASDSSDDDSASVSATTQAENATSSAASSATGSSSTDGDSSESGGGDS
jgi:hypothetical protein